MSPLDRYLGECASDDCLLMLVRKLGSHVYSLFCKLLCLIVISLRKMYLSNLSHHKGFPSHVLQSLDNIQGFLSCIQSFLQLEGLHVYVAELLKRNGLASLVFVLLEKFNVLIRCCQSVREVANAQIAINNSIVGCGLPTHSVIDLLPEHQSILSEWECILSLVPRQIVTGDAVVLISLELRNANLSEDVQGLEGGVNAIFELFILHT
mmetsp:Transcript_22157/g.39036  ORF Transcript_22157/g.39036 Transcript_22157/m.39036 type:complete len:208 (-) Transcript_22157:591-1214(-)